MSLQLAICFSSFSSLLFSSSQVAFLASSSEWAFSTSLSSSLIVFSLVYSTSTFFLLCACSRANLAFLKCQLLGDLGWPSRRSPSRTSAVAQSSRSSARDRSDSASLISPSTVCESCLKMPSSYSMTAISATSRVSLAFS